jgi:hypothetical protein
MQDRDAIKADLIMAIEASQPDGTYDDAGYERINRLVNELVPLTPLPRPVDDEAFVEAPWRSLYAAFGAKHTAGKPIQHTSNLKVHSFSRFPDVPIKVTEIEQEIRVEGKHYNNVVSIATPDGSYPATIIVWGRYALNPDAPQRYSVEFYAVELVPPSGSSAEELRERFGLEADAPLYRELKPPRLHSDVVYCDDDMRINFGSMGGVYVMRRLHEPGKSVSFA